MPKGIYVSNGFLPYEHLLVSVAHRVLPTSPVFNMGQTSTMRMRQSLSQYETAFEQEAALERRRRKQLRQRAANRSRARRIARTEQRGKVAFGTLLAALSVTVVTVTVVMFETLAWLMA